MKLESNVYFVIDNNRCVFGERWCVYRMLDEFNGGFFYIYIYTDVWSEYYGWGCLMVLLGNGMRGDMLVDLIDQ